MKIYCQSLTHTMNIARCCAQHIQPGMVIGLNGDLGAGKTTFSQAFGKAIGVTDTITSPTFSIIKEYKATSMPFYHMDVYRLTIEEADSLGLEEYFDSLGATLVEWSDQIQEIMPKEYLHIQICVEDAEQRSLLFTSHGKFYEKWLENIKEAMINV